MNITTPIILTAVVSATSHANIVNSGFEIDPELHQYSIIRFNNDDTFINGWDPIYSGVEVFDPTRYHLAASLDGGYAINVTRKNNQQGGIQQAIQTTAGQTYAINFYFGTTDEYGKAGSAQVTLSADSTSQTFNITKSGFDDIWTTQQMTFTAEDSSTMISFTGNLQNGDYGVYIDGVTISKIVPSPSTASLLLLIPCASHRRRRK